MSKFRFEKLSVWQAARSLNCEIYRSTKPFPTAERFALVDQLCPASISISSNIAEGSGRNSDKDFAHFLEQSYSSAMEVASQLFLAFDQSYLSESALNELLTAIDKIAAQLVALNRSLNVETSKVKIAKR